MLSGYSKYAAITIPANSVLSDQIGLEIPVLIPQDSILSTTAQNSGVDIAFSLQDGTTLPFEISKYSPTTGELLAFVKIPTILSASDTVFYINAGKIDALSLQDTATLWADYSIVAHCVASQVSGAPDATVKDSSPFLTDGIVTSGALLPARILSPIGAGYFLDGSQGISFDGARFNPYLYTVTLWFSDLAAGNDGGATLANICGAGGDTEDVLRAEWKFPDWSVKHDWGNKISGVPGTTAGTHKVTVTYDDATSDLILYGNGVEISRVSGSNIPQGITAAYANFGLRFGDSDWPICDISGISISERAIQPDREAAYFSSQSTPTSFSQVGAWVDAAPQVVSTTLSIIGGDTGTVSASPTSAITLHGSQENGSISEIGAASTAATAIISDSNSANSKAISTAASNSQPRQRPDGAKLRMSSATTSAVQETCGSVATTKASCASEVSILTGQENHKLASTINTTATITGAVAGVDSASIITQSGVRAAISQGSETLNSIATSSGFINAALVGGDFARYNLSLKSLTEIPLVGNTSTTITANQKTTTTTTANQKEDSLAATTSLSISLSIGQINSVASISGGAYSSGAVKLNDHDSVSVVSASKAGGAASIRQFEDALGELLPTSSAATLLKISQSMKATLGVGTRITATQNNNSLSISSSVNSSVKITYKDKDNADLHFGAGVASSTSINQAKDAASLDIMPATKLDVAAQEKGQILGAVGGSASSITVSQKRDIFNLNLTPLSSANSAAKQQADVFTLKTHSLATTSTTAKAADTATSIPANLSTNLLATIAEIPELAKLLLVGRSFAKITQADHATISNFSRVQFDSALHQSENKISALASSSTSAALSQASEISQSFAIYSSIAAAINGQSIDQSASIRTGSFIKASIRQGDESGSVLAASRLTLTTGLTSSTTASAVLKSMTTSDVLKVEDGSKAKIDLMPLSKTDAAIETKSSAFFISYPSLSLRLSTVGLGSVNFQGNARASATANATATGYTTITASPWVSALAKIGQTSNIVAIYGKAGLITIFAHQEPDSLLIAPRPSSKINVIGQSIVDPEIFGGMSTSSAIAIKQQSETMLPPKPININIEATQCSDTATITATAYIGAYIEANSTSAVLSRSSCLGGKNNGIPSLIRLPETRMFAPKVGARTSTVSKGRRIKKAKGLIMLSSKRKDASEFFKIDWKEWLKNRSMDGSTIQSSSWDIEAGISGSLESFNETTTSIFLYGGEAGQTYTMKNTIVTSNGEINYDFLRVKITA